MRKQDVRIIRKGEAYWSYEDFKNNDNEGGNTRNKDDNYFTIDSFSNSNYTKR